MTRTRTWWMAAIALSALGTAPAQDDDPRRLVKQLRSRDVAERLAAAEALGRLGPDAAPAAAALAATLGDDQASVARAAALALGRIGKRAQRYVKRALHDSDTERLAAVALGEMGEAGVPLLPDLTRLWRKEGLEIRAAVEEGLTGLGDLAVPHLRPLVLDPGLATYVMQYLRDADPALARALVPELIELAPRAWFGSPEALTVLGHARDPRALPVLVEAVQQYDPADPVFATKAERAVRALGEFGPVAKPALPAMLALLGDDDATPRLKAFTLRALGDVGIPAEPVLAHAAHARAAGGKVAEAAKCNCPGHPTWDRATRRPTVCG